MYKSVFNSRNQRLWLVDTHYRGKEPREEGWDDTSDHESHSSARFWFIPAELTRSEKLMTDDHLIWPSSISRHQSWDERVIEIWESNKCVSLLKGLKNVLTSLLFSELRAVAMRNWEKISKIFLCVILSEKNIKQKLTNLIIICRRDLGLRCHVLRGTSSWIRICFYNRRKNQIKILTYSPGDAVFPFQMAFIWTEETRQETGSSASALLHLYIFCFLLLFVQTCALAPY